MSQEIENLVPIGLSDSAIKISLSDSLLILTSSLIAGFALRFIFQKYSTTYSSKTAFGNTLVRGRSLVPKPAKGIIACLIIAFFYI